MLQRIIFVAASAALLTCAATAVHAQPGTPQVAVALPDQDRTVQLLRDSISTLQGEINKLDLRLRQQGIPLPQIQSVTVLDGAYRFDNRAYIPVLFQGNGIGRVRVTLRSTNGQSLPRPVTMSKLAGSDTLLVTGLNDNTEYSGIVEILSHVGDSVATGMRSHPVPTFTTARRVDAPAASIGTVTTVASAATVRAQANQNAYFQVLLHNETAGQAPDTTNVRIVGDPIQMRYGAPVSITPAAQMRDIALAGLTPGAKYFIRVVAINSQGKADTTDYQRITMLPREFGFSGPTAIMINPVSGLVVTWKSTAPADSARLNVPIPSTTGDFTSYKATASADSMTFTATVPYAVIQNATTSPTLSILLFPRGGGRAHQTQIAMGIQKPENNAWNALSGTQRRDTKHIYDQLTAGRTPDLESLLRSGLKLFTTLGPLVGLPTLPIP